MEAAHLLLELLDQGVQLQVVGDHLRAEFPAGTRTPDRAEAIRTERDRLIDLASRSAAEILATLREAGLIISLAGDRVRVKGRRNDLTAEHRGLIRFHKVEISNELRQMQLHGPLHIGRMKMMVDRLLEFGPAELETYRLELVICPEGDPATPEEWAALARVKRIRAGSVGRYIACDCGTTWDRVLIPACPNCDRLH
jgi:hypothetical protein